MAAGELNAGPDVDCGPAWLAPFLPWLAATDPRPLGRLDLDRLNACAAARGLALDSGLPVRFVDADSAEGSLPYEAVIAGSGQVPTRCSGPGMIHDWFNALCWLRWPALKARMNRLQAGAIAAGEIGGDGRRGRLRDAVTLFDESGALFIGDDDEAMACLRRGDWRGLFLTRRQGFGTRLQVLLVGHALLEKLCDPYKAICAQALPLAGFAGAPGLPDGPGTHGSGAHDPDAPGLSDHGFALLDAQAAATLDPAGGFRAVLAPLPLLGVPGWWPANEDPAFYNDPKVFRSRADNPTRGRR